MSIQNIQEPYELIFKPIAVPDYEEATQLILKVGVQQFNINDWCENKEQAEFMAKCLRTAIESLRQQLADKQAMPCDVLVEAVAKIIRNPSGQIILQDNNGGSFDISKHVGKTLFTAPPQPQSVKDALEAAAKICEGVKPIMVGNYFTGQREQSDKCAKAIRALIDKQALQATNKNLCEKAKRVIAVSDRATDEYDELKQAIAEAEEKLG